MMFFKTHPILFLNFIKGWISGSADHFIPELAQLLYPLFSHIYIRFDFKLAFDSF